MVSMDDQHTWVRFPLETLFQNSNQHLALPRPPVAIPYIVSVVKQFAPPRYVHKTGGESGVWTIRKVVHPSRSNRLVDNAKVEETTMNRHF